MLGAPLSAAIVNRKGNRNTRGNNSGSVQDLSEEFKLAQKENPNQRERKKNFVFPVSGFSGH